MVFCGEGAVTYNVYLNPGETLYGLDRIAQTAFLSAGTLGATPCSKEAKNFVCSQVLKACNATPGSNVPATQPLPPCKSVCNRLLECMQSPDAECPDEAYDDTKLAASASRDGLCTYIPNSGMTLQAPTVLLALLVLSAALLGM